MIQMKSKTWLDVRGVAKAVQQATVAPMAKVAITISNEAKKSMKSGRSSKGRNTKGQFQSAQRGDAGAYYNSFLRRYVTASDAGDPPNAQTGNLKKGIRAARTIRGYVIGPRREAFYGRFLEFGTPNMKARPFMRPALMKAVPKFPSFFKNLTIANTPEGARLNASKRPL